MNTTGFNFPPQRLSYKDKIKNDMEWAKEVIKLIKLNYMYTNEVYDNMVSNYDLYNNRINPKDFEYTCKLLGIKENTFPELEVYNKTSNKINVLLSEEEKRPFEYKAILINGDGIKTKVLEREAQLKEVINTYIQKLMQGENPELQDELEKVSESKYLSTKEKSANKLLNYFYRKEDIKGLKNDSFKHGLLAGLEVVWVGIENGNPKIEVINPTGFFYHKGGNTKFIEDGLFAGSTGYMTIGDVLDKYGEYMTEDEMDRIEKYAKGNVSRDAAEPHSDMRYYHEDFNIASMYGDDSNTMGDRETLRGQYGWNTFADIRVTHVEWRSQKKVGFLSGTDPESGELIEDIVSEDLVIPPYAVKKKNTDKPGYTYLWDSYSLVWGWIPEVWEGVIIFDDIFVKVGPKKFQFRSLDNPYKVKLGYHGAVYSATNSTPVSVMDRMKPFQYLYTMLMYKMKKLIALDKPPLIGLDTSMVDPKLGFEKTMYYLEELGIDFYNSLENADKVGASGRSGKMGGSQARTTINHIHNYIALMEAIDQQIGDVAGVNRQREGQVAPTEAVTNVQSQITQSSIITELMFQLHFKIWERVLGTLIEISKTAWNNSKVLQYILDDMSLITLQFNPDELLDSDFGIFLTNTSKEHMILHQLQQLGLTLMQNDKVDLASYINMLSSSSLEQVKDEIRHAQKKMEKLQQQMMQQQQEQAMQQQQLVEESKQKDREFELLKMRLEHDYDMQEAEVESFKFVNDQDINDNAIPDQLEIERFKLDKRKHEDAIRIKEAELKIKDKVANRPPKASS